MNNCEQFAWGSRRRQICEGTSELSREKTNRFRQQYGLDPLLEEEAISSEKSLASSVQALAQPVTIRVTARQKTPSEPRRSCCGGGKQTKPTAMSKKLNGRGVGSKLIALFKSAGFESCPACIALAAQMDAWGIGRCKLKMADIVADILPRAIQWEADKLGWWAKLVPESVTELAIKELVNRAIKMAEKQFIDNQNSRNRSRNGEFHPPLIGVPINRDRLVTHMIYHFLPLDGAGEAIWRRHVAWIREVRDNFNGRLIIGINENGSGIAGCSIMPPEAVMEAFDGIDAEFVISQNDNVMGEGQTFLKMLEMIETTDPDEVVFYGHTKGVTRNNVGLDQPPHLWTEAMFDLLFRNRDEAVNALDDHGVVGSFRMKGGRSIGSAGVGPWWFFSGTFFAIRSVDVFSRNWRHLSRHYGCVEQWPRFNFNRDIQAACLFHDDTDNLYDVDYWRDKITPQLNTWKSNKKTREYLRVLEHRQFRPGICVLTMTGDRPDAFALCEQWIKRQTIQPDQWIVVDDGSVPTQTTMNQTYVRRSPSRGEGHTMVNNLMLSLPHINHDKIVFIEDDEWYDETYMETMSNLLDQHELVGCGKAKYYWPRQAKFREFPEHSHASLCRTGICSSLIGRLIEACNVDNPSVDLRLWKSSKGFLHEPGRPLSIGFKGVPGRKSGGGDHRLGVDDKDLSMLRQWIGDDVERYRKFLPKKINTNKDERVVVYTVVIGGYDVVKTPTVINDLVRYVAITDGEAPYPWEIIRPEKSDRTIRHESRYWKINGPGLFDHDISVYIDGQLQLAVDPWQLIAECEAWGDSDLYLFRHQDRNCVYDEANAVIEIGRDTKEIVRPQVVKYRDAGFPANTGLFLGGILIRRSGKCQKFNEQWWAEIAAGSHRDQISLPVALQLSDINYTTLPANWWRHFFLIHDHAVGR